MQMELPIEDGVLRARLTGRMTGEDTEELFTGIFGRLPQSGKLILNVARVEYVSSSGLGQMVKLFKDLHDIGGSMVVAGASERVRGLFDLAGMGQLISFTETESEALQILLE